MSRHQFKYAQQHVFFRGLAWLFRQSWLLNIRRVIFRMLPYLRMQSQAKNTVYMSWLVDVDQLQARFPEPIQLWQRDGKTIFSILFYHHHHFGPHCFGPLRKLFPSPKQSNWRFYLAPSQLPQAVVFEQIVVDKMLYVFGGRLLSDAMPAQYDPQLKHQVEDGQAGLDIQAKIHMDQRYDLKVHLTQAPEQQLPEDWQGMFESWDAALEFFVPQQHVWVEGVDRPQHLAQADIRIDTDLSQIKAMQIEQIECGLFAELGITADSPALCFHIPELDFHVLNEHCRLPNQEAADRSAQQQQIAKTSNTEQ